MSPPAKIEYLTGQRKRKRLGWVREVSEVAGRKMFKIQKRTKLSWIGESDVVMEKAEATESAVGGNVGRGQAPQEVHFNAEGKVELGPPPNGIRNGPLGPGKYVIDQETGRQILETVTAPLKETCKAIERIQQVAQGLASGASVPVRGDQSGGQPDMFPEIAPSIGHSPRKGQSPRNAEPNGVLEGGLPKRSQLDRSKRKGGNEPWLDPSKLELTRDEIEAIRKRIIRAAKRGDLKGSAKEIYARAVADDYKFFVMLSIAIQSRKKKKTIAQKKTSA